MIRSFPLVVSLVLLAGCGEAATRQAPVTLEELAAGWSGGRTDPTCQNRGPRGEYLGDIPGREYCQWPTVARGAEWGTVGGHRTRTTGLSDIVWERRVRGEEAISRLADSLSKALVAQGLLERPCREGARRWEGGSLAVELNRSPRPGDSLSTIIVFASTIPGALSDIFCAPAMKQEPVRPRRGA
jgi:hypothetical protein